jgi:hypothetical protein
MNAFTHPNALIALPCATALVEPKPPQECPTRTTAPLVRWAMKEESMQHQPARAQRIRWSEDAESAVA